MKWSAILETLQGLQEENPNFDVKRGISVSLQRHLLTGDICAGR